jgi:hypothetical protein
MAKDKKLTISGISVPVKRTPFAEWVAKNENLPLAIYEQAVQRLLGLTMLQMNAKSPDPVHDAEGAGWIDKLETMLSGKLPVLPRSGR